MKEELNTKVKEVDQCWFCPCPWELRKMDCPDEIYQAIPKISDTPNWWFLATKFIKAASEHHSKMVALIPKNCEYLAVFG